jgi:hypothetical protein
MDKISPHVARAAVAARGGGAGWRSCPPIRRTLNPIGCRGPRLNRSSVVRRRNQPRRYTSPPPARQVHVQPAKKGIRARARRATQLHSAPRIRGGHCPRLKIEGSKCPLVPAGAALVAERALAASAGVIGVGPPRRWRRPRRPGHSCSQRLSRRVTTGEGHGASNGPT